MEQIKKENFELSKIKVNKDSVLIIYPYLSDEINIVREELPHKDLLDALSGLIPIIREVYRMDEDERNNVSVTGVIIRNDEKKGVQLNVIGKYYTPAEKFISLNSQEVDMFGNEYKFQKNAEDIIQKITDEAYEYLFNGKKKIVQGDLFNQSEETPKEEQNTTDGKGDDDLDVAANHPTTKKSKKDIPPAEKL